MHKQPRHVEPDYTCHPPHRPRTSHPCVLPQSHPGIPLIVSEDLNEVNFGGAEGLPQPLAAAILMPAYLAWSAGRLEVPAGRFGESGDALRGRVAAAAKTVLGACDEGGQV